MLKLITSIGKQHGRLFHSKLRFRVDACQIFRVAQSRAAGRQQGARLDEEAMAGGKTAATWRQRRSQGCREPSQSPDTGCQRASRENGTQVGEDKRRRSRCMDSFPFLGYFFFLLIVSSNLQELDQAKQAIADLEEDLKAERACLRDLTVEQTRAEREKENVLLQLRRTESDMEDVKLQLQRIKRNNNVLEDELRGA
jgi:hypothetical protein